MILNGRDLIKEFKKQHARSRKSLDAWIKVAEVAKWSNFEELKKTFSSADTVGAVVVFDIAGNNFRLIAKVNYTLGIIQITHVMTHEEYDENRW